MIILRAIKEFTSCINVEQSVFKQIVTGDIVLPQFIVLVKKLLCLCIVGFCDQASSGFSSWDELKNFARDRP